MNFRRAAAVALILGAALSWGCSAKDHRAALPAAPVAPLPAVTPGTLVARLDGEPWVGFASAFPGAPLAPDALNIEAFGANYLILIAVPASASAGDVFSLHGGSLGSIGAVLIPGYPHDGYITTTPPDTGSVTITAIDASRVAGEFHFDAVGSRGSIHVTEGGFDASIVSDSLAAVRSAAMRAARRPAR